MTGCLQDCVKDETLLLLIFKSKILLPQILCRLTGFDHPACLR
jgi:hypothetical protein